MSSKGVVRKWGVTAAISGLTLALALISGWAAAADQNPWPKRFEHPKGTVIMYQPQLEDFKGDRLTARAAVSVKTKEMKAPLFGALWLTGRVLTDRDKRLATIDEVQVTDAKFPSAVNATPEQIDKLKTFLNTSMQGQSISISLDRLLAALEVVEKARAQDQGLKNEPPKIIFATHPTVLVPLDGDPKLLPLPKSSLMRVANTAFLMVYDPAAKTYYLKGGEDWLSSAGLQGPWKEVQTLPAPLKTMEEQVKKAAAAAGQSAPKQVEAQGGQKPAIVVSTVPAELLVTQGEPEYTPITGTNLLYVSNTENTIFMDMGTQNYYALLSGRWFKTASLPAGPWSYVAPNSLPADFAKIPENSVKGFVLVSVAGTPQARDAVLDNSIPQTGVIDRKKATTKVEYAGDPKFEKIGGTDLEYAVNTGTSVFKEGTKYYAVNQGVWYEADSPNGPWQVSASPPREVDKIPPSNPNYSAKYVKVYDATADTVTVGYTPGYTGSYVDNGTVVYGTGYDYPGYSSPEAYIPPPVTYGYAATYNPYAGSWGYQPPYYNPTSWLVPGLVGFAAGMVTGAAIWGHGSYWGGGGWWGAGGYNNVNINNIHNNVINYHPNRRPDHGGHGRPIVHPVVSPHNRQNIYNRPDNAKNLAQRPGQPGKPGERPGASTKRPGQVAQGKPGQVKPGAGQTKPRPQAKPPQTRVKPAGGQNNVLADRHGNVYKRDAKGNWQQRQGNQWTKPGTTARPSTTRPGGQETYRPTTSRPSTTAQSSFNSNQLTRDYNARQRGQERTQDFRRASTPSRPSGYSRPSGGVSRPSGGGGQRGGRRR